MNGYRIGNAFIDFSYGDFCCPYCEYYHVDLGEYYYRRMESAQYGIAKVRCASCRKMFSITTDFTGKVHAFKHTKEVEG